MQSKFADAERHYRTALRLDPNNAIATQNLAVLFAQQGNVNEGLLTIERASIFDGVMPEIHTNRAFMCLATDRMEEALESAETACKISEHKLADERQRNSYLGARLAKAMISATAGLPAQAIAAYREMLKVDPKHPVANPNACFVQSLVFSTPADLLKQRQQWYAANKFDGVKKGHKNDKSTDRPLRVGYVGGDFKRHSAAMIFGNVVLNHTPAVEVYLYSSLAVDPAADPMSKLFMDKAGANWRDISAMNDEDADQLIRNDKIDILIDLAGHTNGGRLPLFTRKPAPVQATAWGFAHGSGLPEMDYFLADPMAVREEERQHFAEKIVDLPCVVSYYPPVEYNLKGTSTLPFYKNEYITFGSYSRYEKLSDECLLTYAEILRRVPDSRIDFKDAAMKRPYSIRRICKLMPDIDLNRLQFSIGTTHNEHMMSHQLCDIALDVWPHGGGVVSLEQCWMGVPLITLYGSQPSGRTASSVLANMGRSDWIARTPDEFIEKAVEWANRPQDLSKARRTLRDELMNSPVVKGYCEAVESRYREMWQTYCEG